MPTWQNLSNAENDSSDSFATKKTTRNVESGNISCVGDEVCGAGQTRSIVKNNNGRPCKVPEKDVQENR